MDHELLAWLEKPENYPEFTNDVEVIQTHISVVFITDQWVYKLKKPVHFTFLDFTTIERRKFYCEEELRLNRRLCPDVYLEVRPLRRSEGGDFSFDEGVVVDYCVMMKRLPEERLMSRCLDRGDSNLEEPVRKIAEIMARLHGQITNLPDEVKEAGSPKHQVAKILGNFAESYQPGLFDRRLFGAVKAGFHSAVPALQVWLVKRAAAGKVVEGHGDLHTRNIFLTDPPTIFDCIEFSLEFRCGDVAMENAFLMMDLIFRGRRDLANVYLDRYITLTGDKEQLEFLPIFIAYQAMVRAKVAALSALDEALELEQQVEQKCLANHYLQLAAASLVESAPQLPVILVCGLPGSGKSHLCRLLASRFGWIHLSSDSIRKELAEVNTCQPLPSEFYSESFSQKTYVEMKKRAHLAAAQLPVLADANFPKVEVRKSFVDDLGRPAFLVWMTCDEEIIGERLRRRALDPGEVSDADLEVYQMLRAKFEAPTEGEKVPLRRIDGSADVEENIAAILSWLLPATIGT